MITFGHGRYGNQAVTAADSTSMVHAINCSKVATGHFRFSIDGSEGYEFAVKESLGSRHERLYDVYASGMAWSIELRYVGDPSLLRQCFSSPPLEGRIAQEGKELAKVQVHYSKTPWSMILRYGGECLEINPAHPRNSGGDLFIQRNGEAFCTIFGDGKRGFQRPIGRIEADGIMPQIRRAETDGILIICGIVLADLFAIPILNTSV